LIFHNLHSMKSSPGDENLKKQSLRQSIIVRDWKLIYPNPSDYPISNIEPTRCTILFDQNGATAIGWIHFVISIDQDSCLLYCSNQCSPFWPLLQWLRVVEKADVPVMMNFNEERWETQLFALPHKDKQQCEIRVFDVSDGEVIFKAAVSRTEFANNVRMALATFIDESYNDDPWWDENIVYNYRWEQPYMDLKWIRAFIDATVPADKFYDYQFLENVDDPLCCMPVNHRDIELK